MVKIAIREAGKDPLEVDLTSFPVVVGRDPNCELPLPTLTISRRHCRIDCEGERYLLTDLGSTNGTLLNGAPVGRAELHAGDRIRIGDVELVFQASAPTSEPVRGPSYREEESSIDHVLAKYYLHPAIPASLEASPAPKTVDPERASRMFYILFQVSKKLGAQSSLEEMLRGSMQQIFQFIRADRGILFLRDGSAGKEELRVVVAYSRSREFRETDTHALSSSILKRAMAERVAIVATDALTDPRFAGKLSIVKNQIRSVLCVPLWDEKDCFGVVYLDSISSTSAFSDEDRALLTGIANLMAIRLRQEQLQEELRREEELRAHLARYNPPDVVDLLIRRGGPIKTERREVTILFADVADSTGLAERLGEQEIHGLMNTFYEMAADAVLRNRGHLNKFVGDAVLAVFNAPLDLEGHEGRAVEAARGLVRAVREWGERNPSASFRVRVGINTGSVIAGDIGPRNRVEYTVIGDAVNVAERLSKVETESGIAVSGETWRKLGGTVRGTDRGEAQVKGRGKPVRIYEVEV